MMEMELTYLKNLVIANRLCYDACMTSYDHRDIHV